MGSITIYMILAILPAILLLVLGLAVLAIDLIVKPGWRRNLGWVTAGGILIIMLLSLWLSRPPVPGVELWGGMIRWDWMGFVFTMLFLFAAAMTALIGMDVDGLGDRGEFYILLIASTIGMTLLASASDLIMLYLSIETVAIPLYVLAGFLSRNDRSVESGFKYFLFGAMSSAVMLYGFTILFAISGTTNIYQIFQSPYMQGLMQGMSSVWPLLAAMVLILIGFGFKISAVPVHFWAPDTYEGAPTPVAGFLSTASKAAGFLVLIRVFMVAFPIIMGNPGVSASMGGFSFQGGWAALMAAISVATMTIGNLLALAQKNIKRLLAYSSIAHAGYALIGIAAVSGQGLALGLTSTVFYLIAYLMTNMAAFGVVSVYSRSIGSDEIKDFAGMSRRAPGLALIMLVAFLSLAGMPPLGGFISKFLVLASAIQSNLYWLAAAGLVNSIIGLYYYLVVLKVIYLYRSDDEDKPAPIPSGSLIGLTVLIVGVILVGIFFSPWFNWSYMAVGSMFQ